MKNLIVILFFFLALTSFKKEPDRELSGLVVILDPGHGGQNDGAYAYFGKDKIKITESAYCYDIALRLRNLLISKGATVYMTVKAQQEEPLNNESDVLIKRDVNSIFTYDNSRVVFSAVALEKRVAYANLMLKKNPNCKIVYIALHFDNLKSIFCGTRIIMGNSSISLANCLKKEFELAKLLSKSSFPVLKNADKKKGIRNLIVLRSTNKIQQKVLIEFANCKNANDLKRIADYQTRDEYALIVTLSLVRFMNSNNGIKLN